METSNTLTAAKLEAIMRDVERLAPPVNDFNPFGLSLKTPGAFAGMKVFVEPEVQKIRVRQLYLRDGTPLLSEEFIKEQNEWYATRFGYKESLCKEHAFKIGGWGLLVSKSQYAMLSNLGA